MVLFLFRAVASKVRPSLSQGELQLWCVGGCHRDLGCFRGLLQLPLLLLLPDRR